MRLTPRIPLFRVFPALVEPFPEANFRLFWPNFRPNRSDPALFSKKDASSPQNSLHKQDKLWPTLRLEQDFASGQIVLNYPWPRNYPRSASPIRHPFPTDSISRSGMWHVFAPSRAMSCAFGRRSFPSSNPTRVGPAQRLYRRREVELALEIKRLVHGEGYTLSGARQALEQGRRRAADAQPALPLAAGESGQRQSILAGSHR